MTRYILTYILGCMTLVAMAKEPLADELRWSPVETTDIPVNPIDTVGVTEIEAAETVDIVEIDSIAPFNPELSRWGTDSIQADVDPNRNWWHLFKKGKLSMSDPTVEWPGFLGFCVKVYNWADHVFSSTDHDYVVGTVKRWRARLINDNWTDSYYMRFSKDFNSIMSGRLHVLAGASLQYMAVSYTYSLDLSHLITGGIINYKKQEFGFNCARFSIDGYYYSNNGGTYIRRFGNYKNKRHIRIPFSGITMSTLGFDGYYFFDGYKYSQGAAYNFSKIQKKSHGCIMAGLSYCFQDINMDFTQLPEELVPYNHVDREKLRFHYNDYNILVGYGYNCVMGKHWLYNITVIPGIGFNNCYEDSEQGSAKLLSISGRAMTSFTYNSGNLFAGLQGRIRGNWYRSKLITLFNTIESITLSAGFRF